MRRRAVVTLVVVGAVVIAVVVVSLGVVLDLFHPQVAVTVVNDRGRSVDLSCLWDDRENLRPGHASTLSMDSGTVEDCGVLEHYGDGGYGCLHLDTRGALAVPHEVRVSSARTDGDCET